MGPQLVVIHGMQPCSDPILYSAGADAFLMEALFRNEVWGFMQLPVSKENEAGACRSMIDGCRYMVC